MRVLGNEFDPRCSRDLTILERLEMLVNIRIIGAGTAGEIIVGFVNLNMDDSSVVTENAILP